MLKSNWFVPVQWPKLFGISWNPHDMSRRTQVYIYKIETLYICPTIKTISHSVFITIYGYCWWGNYRRSNCFRWSVGDPTSWSSYRIMEILHLHSNKCYNFNICSVCRKNPSRAFYAHCERSEVKPEVKKVEALFTYINHIELKAKLRAQEHFYFSPILPSTKIWLVTIAQRKNTFNQGKGSRIRAHSIWLSKIHKTTINDWTISSWVRQLSSSHIGKARRL